MTTKEWLYVSLQSTRSNL